MIRILEGPSQFIPVKYSIWVEITQPEVLHICKNSSINFKPKGKWCECNPFDLPYLVNNLIKLDDVKFIPYEEKPKLLKKFKNNKKFKEGIKPYPHQLSAIEYGLNKDKWLLLDDMGLGKTLSIILLFETLKKERGFKKCLIICGVSSLRFNWEQEINKFSNLDCIIPGQKVSKTGKIRIEGISKRIEVFREKIKESFVIINRETLTNKKLIDLINKGPNKFDMVVVDEIHRFKNAKNKLTPGKVKKLTKKQKEVNSSGYNLLKLKIPYKVGLSGTPLVNKPEDSFVPLNFIGKEFSLSTFRKLYTISGGFQGREVIGYKNLPLLKELWEEYSLRRLKEDILNLPEKIYKVEYIEMTNEQGKLYNDISLQIDKEMEILREKYYPKEVPLDIEMSANIRRRQVTDWPGIISGNILTSGKVNRCKELVEDIINNGEKVIIFSSFVPTLLHLKKELYEYNPLLFYGGINDDEVKINKDLFNNNPDYKVLLCTWMSAGTGHTFIGANYVIWLSTPWENSSFQQSVDRIHRIGQSKTCNIITLVNKGTYDERVQEILETKEGIIKQII